MELNEFVKAFASEFDETPIEAFAPETKFKDLEEWSSLTALSIISMVDEKMDKRVTGADIRNCENINDLFQLVLTK
ncbi:MAG: acyl carrier protein [Bacteroidales bacterium]|jgi:acyl carrier protein